MDQSSAPVPVVEAAASTFVPAEDVTNAMDVVPGEEPKKIRLTKAEKRALAESKRKEAWKSKVRPISNSTATLGCEKTLLT